MESRVDQAIEGGAVGRIDGDDDTVCGSRPWNVGPVVLQARGDGVGLALEAPTGVVGGPGHIELVAAEHRGDVGRGGAYGLDKAQGAVSGQGASAVYHN